MKDKGFEQQNLFAAHCKIATNALSRVVKGHGNPAIEFISKILAAYPDINARWLLYGEGENYTENSHYINDIPSTTTGEPNTMYSQSTIDKLVDHSNKLLHEISVMSANQARLLQNQADITAAHLKNSEAILNFSREKRGKQKQPTPEDTG